MRRPCQPARRWARPAPPRGAQTTSARSISPPRASASARALSQVIVVFRSSPPCSSANVVCVQAPVRAPSLHQAPARAAPQPEPRQPQLTPSLRTLPAPHAGVRRPRPDRRPAARRSRRASRLVQLERQAELLERHPSGAEDLTRCLGPAAHRLEHRLTAERDRLDVTIAWRHPQDPHHVQAAAARAHDRRGTPQRSGGRGRKHRGDPPAILGRTGGRERAVERLLDRRHLAEARIRGRGDVIGLRLARQIAQLAQAQSRRAATASTVAAVCSARREICELPREHGRTRALDERVLPGRSRPAGDRRLGAAVATSPADRVASARSHRISARLALPRASARPSRLAAAARSSRRERPASSRVQPLGRPRAEPTSRFVQQAELAPVRMRLLKVKGDHLLVLADEIAGLRIQPVGEPLVQLGPRLLQQRAGRRRRGSARDGTGRPAHRSSRCPPARPCPCAVAPPDGRRSRRAPRRHQLGDRAAEELLADHRRTLDDRALVGAAGARSARRAAPDRRRDLDVGQLARRHPRVAARDAGRPRRRASAQSRRGTADFPRPSRASSPTVHRGQTPPRRPARRPALGSRPRREGRARSHPSRAAPSDAQRVARLAQLRTRERDDQDR